MRCHDDRVGDYLNEDGLSFEPRGFSQSGLFTACIIWGPVEIGCIQKKGFEIINCEIHKSRFFLLEGIFF